MDTNSQIIIYQTESGETKLEVRLENETVWLTQKLMAELFQTTKQNISLHLQNIFAEGELSENSVVKDFLTTESRFNDPSLFSARPWPPPSSWYKAQTVFPAARYRS